MKQAIMPRVEVLDMASVTFGEVREVYALMHEIWPKPGADANKSADAAMQRQVRGEYVPGQQLWCVVRQGDRVMASAGTFPRRITVGTQAMTVLALAGVCTRPEARQRGLGAAVVKASFARVDSGAFAFLLFQTSWRNEPWYRGLGAARIDNRCVNSLAQDPQANPWWDEIVMAYPAARAFPAGTIDLLGPGY